MIFLVIGNINWFYNGFFYQVQKPASVLIHRLFMRAWNSITTEDAVCCQPAGPSCQNIIEKVFNFPLFSFCLRLNKSKTLNQEVISVGANTPAERNIRRFETISFAFLFVWVHNVDFALLRLCWVINEARKASAIPRLMKTNVLCL